MFYARFVFFDDLDLLRLLFQRHVLVDDADAPFLRHGDGQAGFRDGVHGGGDQRRVEVDLTGQARLQPDITGKDLRVGRHQGDVVKGEGFAD